MDKIYCNKYEYLNCFVDKIEMILDYVVTESPLIHCITNPISINDCANSILALGAKPIMAEHPKEVADITQSSSALCLNMGNITDARLESMQISFNSACHHKIPSILDCVGITCSSFRYDYVTRLIHNESPNVIKGNLSEIKKLCGAESLYVGIDSIETLDNNDIENIIDMINNLSLRTGSIIVASGKVDIISNGNIAVLVHNGSEYLTKVTGTGCILNVIIGTFLSANNCSDFDAAILGTAYLGICGEISYDLTLKNGVFEGTGAYHINLINTLSTISPKYLKQKLRINIY